MEPQETSPKPLPDTLNVVASDGSDMAKLGREKKNTFLLKISYNFINYTSIKLAGEGGRKKGT